MDLIRQILNNAEARDFENGEPPEAYQTQTIEEAYQIVLMNDAGLVQALANSGVPANVSSPL